jgi:hypothetical protein
MTTKEISQSTIDALSSSAMFKLKLALDVAFDHGGFDAVIAVCNDLTKGAAKTNRPVGIWADVEWRGLDFLEAKFPGCTRNLAKYMPNDDEVDEDARAEVLKAAGLDKN